MLYDNFDKNLYKIRKDDTPIDEYLTTKSIIDPSQIGSGQSSADTEQLNGGIKSGKSRYDNTETGYILGVEKGVPKFYIGNTTDYLSWDGSSLSVSGTFNIGGVTITIDNTKDIQTYIDIINAEGGGTLYLNPGTYNVSSDINLYNDVKITGSGSSSTFIDFGGGAYSLKAYGTNDYSTGTVTIANGATTVTGNGTTWTAGMVGQTIFMGDFFYEIATFVDVDEITITEAYDGLDLTTAYYKIATPVFFNQLKNFAVQNSSQAAIDFKYSIYANVDGISCYDAQSGLKLTDCMSFTMASGGMEIGNCTYGMYFLRSPGYTIISSIIFNATEHGVYLEYSGDATVFNTGIYACTKDGIHIKNSYQTAFLAITCDSCGESGIELEAGCDKMAFTGIALTNNTGDGIKLTATSDNNTIVANTIIGNGGYGINIAASTCNNNIISANSFDSNTSGNIYSDGTPGSDFSGTTTIQYTSGTWFNLISNTSLNLTSGNGIYLVKVGPFNTWDDGGTIYNETAVFLASLWGSTNSTGATAIPCTFGGHSNNGKTISFQYLRAASGATNYIQMKVDETLTSSIDIPWQANRIF